MLQDQDSNRSHFDAVNAARYVAVACLVLGLWVLVYPMFNVPYEEVTRKSDLTPLHGRIVGAVTRSNAYVSPYHSIPGRPASVNLIVDVPGRNSYANRFQQDPAVASALMDLKDGDEVDMLVDDHGGNSLVDGQSAENYIWELHRDGQMLLSYERTRDFVITRYGDPKAWWIRLTGVVLLLVAAVTWGFFTGTGSLAEEEAEDD